MSKKLTEAKIEAIKRYDAANTRQIHLKLNKNTDADLLDWLDSQGESIQGYIRRLVRADMEHRQSLERARKTVEENAKKAAEKCNEFELTFPAIDGFRDEEACRICQEQEHTIYVHRQEPWEVRVDMDAMKVLTVNAIK